MSMFRRLIMTSVCLLLGACSSVPIMQFDYTPVYQTVTKHPGAGALSDIVIDQQTPEGERIYTADYFDRSVRIFNTNPATPERHVALPFHPLKLAAASDIQAIFAVGSEHAALINVRDLSIRVVAFSTPVTVGDAVYDAARKNLMVSDMSAPTVYSIPIGDFDRPGTPVDMGDVPRYSFKELQQRSLDLDQKHQILFTSNVGATEVKLIDLASKSLGLTVFLEGLKGADIASTSVRAEDSDKFMVLALGEDGKSAMLSLQRFPGANPDAAPIYSAWINGPMQYWQNAEGRGNTVWHKVANLRDKSSLLSQEYFIETDQTGRYFLFSTHQNHVRVLRLDENTRAATLGNTDRTLPDIGFSETNTIRFGDDLTRFATSSSGELVAGSSYDGTLMILRRNLGN